MVKTGWDYQNVVWNIGKENKIFWDLGYPEWK